MNRKISYLIAFIIVIIVVGLAYILSEPGNETVQSRPIPESLISEVDAFLKDEYTYPGTEPYMIIDEAEYFDAIRPFGTRFADNLYYKVEDETITPICKTKDPTTIDECLFINTSSNLIFEDINNDFYPDVVEIVDEYPPEGGRGKAVILGIYSYKDDYFEPQVHESYNNLFNIITNNNEEDRYVHFQDWDTNGKNTYDLVLSFWE